MTTKNLKKTKMKTKIRVKKILKLLKQYLPSAHCALEHASPFQLLVATILSAQCTDKRVNLVTKKLFKKYPTASLLAKASLSQIEKDIHSTGFFKAKAKNLKYSSQKIVKEFNNQVPSSLKDLLTLNGVGRKTAHVVLGTAFHIPSGVVVDTHVGRLSFRLGLSTSKNPVKIEKDLNDILPFSSWIYFSHALILHGRQVCKSRKPTCHVCFLEEFCPKVGVLKTVNNPEKS